MLWRALKHVEKGFYIDIGAQDPVIDSVSLAFYEHGWRGVHVEPSSYYADKLRLARPDETVIQSAIGSKSGVLSFYEIDATGLSTGDAQIAEKHRTAGFTTKETAVSCLPLADILDCYHDYDIHWIKIDVEGMESEVIQGWLPSEVRPWIVVVESTLPLSQVETHGEWEPLLIKLGYEFVYFDGLNMFYVSNTHQGLKEYFRCPPNVFDSFALSGTNSSVFCVLLNNKLTQREQEFIIQIQRSREETQSLMYTLSERDRQVGELQTRAEWLNNKWEAARGSLDTANMSINELELSLERQEAVLKELQAQAEWLNKECNASKVKINELNDHAHHWWRVADGLSREIQAVYASRTWRLTKPLRWVNRHFKRILEGIKSMLLCAPCLHRKLVRRILEIGLTHVRRHPKHKAYFKGLLARWPWLQARLYTFAVARHEPTAIAAPPFSVAPADSANLSDCPVSVRTTYLQLAAARARADQSRVKEGLK